MLYQTWAHVLPCLAARSLSTASSSTSFPFPRGANAWNITHNLSLSLFPSIYLSIYLPTLSRFLCTSPLSMSLSIHPGEDTVINLGWDDFPFYKVESPVIKLKYIYPIHLFIFIYLVLNIYWFIYLSMAISLFSFFLPLRTQYGTQTTKKISTFYP